VARLKRGKKRKAIPNPNRRFMALSEALAASEIIPKVGDQVKPIIVDSDSEEDVGLEIEVASEIEVRAMLESPLVITRPGRLVVKNVRYE
jgi:hypothetical protein